MEAKLQRRVQRYGWDAAAPHYHDSWQAQLKAAQDTLLALAALEPGQRVLEVAAGSGRVTARAAEAVGAAGRVLASDLAGEMVADLAQRLAAQGLDNVDCARMDAEALKAEDGVFDRAICALGLMYLPDPEQALREIQRALKPGGRLAVTVWGERRNCGWAEIFPIVDAQVASEVCPLFFATGGKGVLTSLAQGLGFQNVEERRQTETLVFASAAALIRAVVDGGPVALAVKRFSPRVREEVEAAFLTSVAAHLQPDGSYRIPGEFVTVATDKPI